MKHTLFADSPASYFEEAYPLGNGSLGAMVYGGTECSVFSFNADTLWSGFPTQKQRKGAYKHLDHVRSLVASNDFKAATDILHKEFLSEFTESYQPVGKALLTIQQNGQAEEYSRTLSLANACANVQYKKNGVDIGYEVFCTYPHKVFALRLNCSKPVNVQLQLECNVPCRFASKAALADINAVACALLANAPAHVEPSYFPSESPITYRQNGQLGMAYGFCASVCQHDGTASSANDTISLKGCTFATILINIETGFNGFNQMPSTSPEGLLLQTAHQHNTAIDLGWDNLKAQHIKDYAPIFEKNVLSFGTDSTQTLQSLLAANADEKNYPFLTELLYNYGRYLLIASSRKGTQAANLQGIWNEQQRPPWSSNYTLNINATMNYWHAEACNLHTCHLPLLQLVEQLAENGAIVAREQYNMGGWVAHHNTDIWRQAAPVGLREGSPVSYAFWPMGGAWLCLHLWDMWNYSRDNALLKRIYPLLCGAAEFFCDYLTIDENGYYITTPSTSPENVFLYNGESTCLCKMSTMDNGILRELFSNCLVASQLLSAEGTIDKRIKNRLEHLPPYRIDASGRIAEWNEDYTEKDVNHRHLSHLFGLYPGSTISTPELCTACEQSLLARGDEGTGWSLAWKANLWARLGKGNDAYRLITNMLRLVQSNAPQSAHGGGVYQNLLCAHPPFQIDGNFGITAAIAQMLLQWRNNCIYLLPALPQALPNGSINGLCAPGGISVDMQWQDCKLIHCKITSAQKCEVNACYNGTTQCIKLDANAFCLLV